MSLGAAVARNSLIQIVGKIASTLLALIAVAMTTRYLGQDGYGSYTTVMTFLQFFGIIADMGLYMVLIRELAKPGVDADRLTSHIFTLRLVSAVLLLGIAPLVSLAFPYTTEIRIGIAMASVSFLCITLNQVLLGLYQKHLRIWWFTVAELVGRVLLIAGIWWTVSRDGGLYGVLAATVAGSAINFIIVLVRSRAFARIRLSYDGAEWRRLLIMAAPLAFSVMLNVVYFKADTLILSWFWDEATVGIYGAPYKMLEVLITFPAMFAGFLFTPITQAYEVGDRERFQALLQRGFTTMSFVALPLIAGTWALAGPLMRVVAGPEFVESAIYLRLLIVATGTIFVGNLFTNTVVTLHRQRQMMWVYAVVAVVAITGYLILIPRYGAWGAASMTILTEISVATCAAIMVLRAGRVRLALSPVFRSMLSAAVMTGVIVVIGHVVRGFFLTRVTVRDGIVDLVIVGTSVAIGAVVYGGLLILLRVVRIDELRRIVTRS